MEEDEEEDDGVSLRKVGSICSKDALSSWIWRRMMRKHFKFLHGKRKKEKNP